MKMQCACCGQDFAAWRKDQRYCMREDCRKERKKALQKVKLSTDVDYKRNQADAQRRWREKHKDYWRGYRERHPWYVERNRRLQRKRNAKRRKRSFLQEEGADDCKGWRTTHWNNRDLPIDSGIGAGDCKNGRYRCSNSAGSKPLEDCVDCKERTLR